MQSEKKNQRQTVRMDDELIDQINERAGGLSHSEYIRRAIGVFSLATDCVRLLREIARVVDEPIPRRAPGKPGRGKTRPSTADKQG